MHTQMSQLCTFSCLLLGCCILPGSIKLPLGGLRVELDIVFTQEVLEFLHREVSQVEQAVSWMVGMKATSST